MAKIGVQNRRFNERPLMKRLLQAAHGNAYAGQVHSVTVEEVVGLVRRIELPSEAVVLNIGCVDGIFALAIAKELPYQFVGVDGDPEMIIRAGDHLALSSLQDRCRFMTRDSRAFKKLRADLIMSLGDLFWSETLQERFETWSELLKPKTRMIIATVLLYGQLSMEEQQIFGATQFISGRRLQSTLADFGWGVVEWEDKTVQHLEWMKRWQSGLSSLKAEMISEFGEIEAESTFQRGNAYIDLLKRGILKRVLIHAER
jgi:cyclopropane fatty-acyl-phospholipid synthase-like methyltransferase